MIGTFIRSTHHFAKSCEYSQKSKIIAIRHNNIIIGDILKIKDKTGHDMFLYFQNINHNIDLVKTLQQCADEYKDVVTAMFATNPRCVLLFNFGELRNYGTQFIMLPTDFDNLYESFTQQNRKIVDPVFNKYCYKDDDFSKAMFAICENANFFVWGVKNVRNNRIAFMTIYRIMVWNKLYGQLVNKLNKGTITAYNNTKTVLDLLKECENLRKNKRANDIINLFNTEQKKLLKNNFSKLPMAVLSKFAILSKTKQQNFIRKVSTMSDLDEIIRLMMFTTSQHFKWNKESLLNYIANVEGLNCKIIFTSDTAVLVEVNDYDTIKKLAKTTNWCISKNKTYWNNYMKKKSDSNQYILFDFSKKEDDDLSIVGFTTSGNKGIIHAHSFTNTDLMKTSRNIDNRPYRSILSNNNTMVGIYSVIANNKIPMSLITRFQSKFTKWDKQSFLEIFHQYISEENYSIYCDENNQMVISTKFVDGIYKLFGDLYLNQFGDYYCNNEHIFFLDFNKDVNDLNKMQFAIILPTSYNSSYKTATTMYNEYISKTECKFNDELNRVGLPYNIICRPDSIKNRFEEAINNHDIDEIEKYLDNDKIKEILLSKHNNGLKNSLSNELIRSINDYFSMDLLNILEKHGYSITNFINHSIARSIIQRYFDEACHCNGMRLYPNEGSFNEEVEFGKLLTNTFEPNDSQNKKMYIARCYVLNRLLQPYLDNEKALNFILTNIFSNFCNYNYSGYITEKIIKLGMKVINFNKLSSELSNIINVVFNYNSTTIIDELLKLDITNEDVRNYILSYCSNKYRNEFRKKWKMQAEEKNVENIPNEKSNIHFNINSSFWNTMTFSDPWAYTVSTT